MTNTTWQPPVGGSSAGEDSSRSWKAPRDEAPLSQQSSLQRALHQQARVREAQNKNPRQCGRCQGNLFVARCGECTQETRVQCVRCGDLGCRSAECRGRVTRQVTLGAVLGVLVGFLCWYGPLRSVERWIRFQDPAMVAWMDFAGRVEDYKRRGNAREYMDQAKLRAPLLMDDYGVEMPTLVDVRLLKALLGPETDERLTLPRAKIQPEDILDLLYGRWIPGEVMGLNVVLQHMDPVPRSVPPAAGDLLVYGNAGSVYWAVLGESPGEVLSCQPGFSKIGIFRITEPYFQTQLLGAFRLRV